ncbi:MAG: ATP-dependent Clp protease adaptor ClpS [Candidatus Kapaibacterium sp.]
MFDLLRQQLERLKRRFAPSTEKGTTTPVSTIRSAIFDSPDEDVMVAEETMIGLPAKVILYNDEIHTFDEVIHQLIKAIRCTSAEAEGIAFEVDTRGLASVFEGELDSCLHVSSILEEIALHTSIEF